MLLTFETELEYYQVLFTLMAAKFQSEKRFEIQSLSVVNDLISAILEAELHEQPMQEAISRYKCQPVHQYILDEVCEDIRTGSVDYYVELGKERFVDALSNRVYPFELSSKQRIELGKFFESIRDL